MVGRLWFRNSVSVRPAYYLIGIDFQRRKNEIKEMMDDVDAPRDEQRTIFREKVIEGLKGLFRSPFMMVKVLRCSWKSQYVDDFLPRYGDLVNLKHQSPTSKNCHQHRPSSTSVINIDVVNY